MRKGTMLSCSFGGFYPADHGFEIVSAELQRGVLEAATSSAREGRPVVPAYGPVRGGGS